jgi:hypothetical protein
MELMAHEVMPRVNEALGQGREINTVAKPEPQPVLA